MVGRVDKVVGMGMLNFETWKLSLPSVVSPH
jgi:hypothetical protein